MNSLRTLPRFALLFGLSLLGCSKPANHNDQNNAAPKATSDLGITFAIPKGFEIQKHKQSIKTWPEIYMVQTDGTNRESKYPLFILLHGFDAKTSELMTSIFTQSNCKYDKQIGPHSALDLPAWPGPCGEEAFFYIVPRGDGTSIGITAPRFISKVGVSKQDRLSSGLDSIIENLITTMRFEANAKGK